MPKLTGSIDSEATVTGTVTAASDISGALSNPLARGYSAYEIAVQNGFSGTQTEWLNSLKPVRGVDYWTKDDIAAIKAELKAYIDTLI